MFRRSTILNELPNITSSISKNLDFMFSGAKIKSSINLNAYYFNNCKDSLENTEEMFSNNYELETLQYNSTRGLFEGCTKLNKVTKMFSDAHSLHKGIPNNLFGSTPLPNLESLEGMF